MPNVIKIAPAAVLPLASFLADEMQARKWTCVDVAKRMSGDYRINIGVVNLVMAVQKDGLFLDDDLFDKLSEAFGVSAEYFSSLHDTWKRWPNARQDFECPEELLGGLIFPANDP